MEGRVLVKEGSQDNLEELLDAKNEELLQFVNDQILSMAKKVIKFEGGTPPISLISDALLTHTKTMLALTSVYETARLELAKAKKLYDVWHAEKYMEIREKYSTVEKTARTEKQKFLSKEEIEYQIIADYKKEYLEFKNKVDFADEKRSTVQRLIDSWSSYQFQLSSIAKLAIQESNSERLSYTSQQEI